MSSFGITIVGLGPASHDLWTQAAYHCMAQANRVYLRTDQHPSIADIPAATHSFEGLALTHLAAEVVRLGQQAAVVYAVPGHPALDDPSVPLIRVQAATHHIPVTIIPGLSWLDAVLTALDVSTENLQVVAAALVMPRHHPPLEPDRPALVTQVTAGMLPQLQQVLLNAYPPDLPVTLIQRPGTPAEQTTTVALASLAAEAVTGLAGLYLPGDTRHTSLSTFQETIAHLRAPEGCPWDRKQTHQTLRPYLLEETFEVLEALDANDTAALADELGDLLLQILLHTQIAIDNGTFRMDEVIGHIHRKMLRRHPHVFDTVTLNDADEVVTNWEAIKKIEKAAQNGGSGPESVLDGIPAALPALMQAFKISKKAARAGFEWPDMQGVLDKLAEEVREVTEATTPAERESELGDVLFTLVNVARWLNVDPESALRATNARFTRRFKHVEAGLAALGKTASTATETEIVTLWNEAKQHDIKP